MRKAALLYNSRSGGRRAQRRDDLQAALKILASAGVEANLTLTQSSTDAADQARKAIADGCDAVFACGGDGTVHDVLQAIAGTRVALGVIPMGTANALAHDLGLPLEPAKAVSAVLEGELRRVAVGRVEVRGFDNNPATRYFTVAVGIGVDAHLFYKLHSGTKQRMGMAAYYAKAWHLWLSYPMTRFRVEFAETGSDAPRQVDVTEMMAVRIRNFGGVLQELAPGASLERNDLRVVFCCTSSRWSYLLYVTRGLLRQAWNVPGIDLAYSSRVSCASLGGSNSPGPGPQQKVYVETDGELVGTLPVEITVVPDALTLLVPSE